jgi:hypothetical protein
LSARLFESIGSHPTSEALSSSATVIRKLTGPGAPIAVSAEFADIQIQLALAWAEWLQQLELADNRQEHLCISNPQLDAAIRQLVSPVKSKNP